MEITKINAKTKKVKTVLRVAAYCRVSTKMEQQENSLEMQKQYFYRLITESPQYVLVDIYCDDKTGRNTKSRDGFQKMMRDCRKGKIDVILTKSVSRFGRNTVDTLKAIRELCSLGIRIEFETEMMNTDNDAMRQIIEVMVIMSQQHSEEKSKNIKWGINRTFENPEGAYYNRPCYGYRASNENRLVQNESEATTVKTIYQLYTEGYSLSGIAEHLEENNIPSPSGKNKWSRQTIDNILTNEKYTGDIILQKTYIADFFNAKQKKNNGERQKYLIQSAHEPIISKEKFDTVQEMRKQRSNKETSTGRKKSKRTQNKYSTTNSLSGKLICAECERNYRRISRHDGKIVWRCANRVEYGTRVCKKSITVFEEEIEKYFMNNPDKEKCIIGIYYT